MNEADDLKRSLALFIRHDHYDSITKTQSVFTLASLAHDFHLLTLFVRQWRLKNFNTFVKWRHHLYLQNIADLQKLLECARASFSAFFSSLLCYHATSFRKFSLKIQNFWVAMKKADQNNVATSCCIIENFIFKYAQRFPDTQRVPISTYRAVTLFGKEVSVFLHVGYHQNSENSEPRPIVADKIIRIFYWKNRVSSILIQLSEKAFQWDKLQFFC